MIKSIEPLIATIPEPLRLAAFQGQLVPFVGAGVSQLGGCHGWNEFANAAIDFFVKNGKLSHAQNAQISSLTSRVKLSIALKLQEEHELKIDFDALLKPTDAKKTKGDKVYDILSQLKTPTIVTTNYDQWLDDKRTVFIKPNDITVENLEVRNSVFHIHGSVTDPDNMVLTTLHYLNRYAGHNINGQIYQENPFLTFLEKLFQIKNVLFIGYSLSELEILEYILQKAVVKPNKDVEPRHYILQGFFSHEIELARSLEGYFLSLGVGLLPFSKDDFGWEQLIEVLEDIAKQLPASRSLALPVLQEMEGLLG